MNRRILVINSNASRVAGAAIGSLARGYAGNKTDLMTISAAAGCVGVDGQLDSAIAAVETAKVISTHADDFDAIVIACGNDPGLAAAREITPRPVIGTAEAGMLQACSVGARFAVPVFSAAKVSAMADLVAHYGLSQRLIGIVAMELTVGEAVSEPTELYRQLLTAGRHARDHHRADVFVLTGTVMAPAADGLQKELGIPVVAGLRAAIAQAEAIVDAGIDTGGTHRRNPQRRNRLIGYPEFEDLYEQAGTEQEMSR